MALAQNWKERRSQHWRIINRYRLEGSDIENRLERANI